MRRGAFEEVVVRDQRRHKATGWGQFGLRESGFGRFVLNHARLTMRTVRYARGIP